MYFYTELAVFDTTTSILSCFSSQSKPLSRLRMASVRIALPGQIKCCSSMNNRSPQQLKKIKKILMIIISIYLFFKNVNFGRNDIKKEKEIQKY